MKKTLTLLTIIAILFSCKKSNSVKDEPTTIPIVIDGSKVGMVNINSVNYSTVVIGKQTWTSVNYNGSGGMINTKKSDVPYGKHYTYEEAKAIKLPDGWRLPSESDFIDLMRNYDGSFGYTSYSNDFQVIDLMSKSTWTVQGNKYLPTNLSGFNAVAGGTYNVSFKYFVQEGFETGFWSLPYYRPFMLTNEFKNGIGTFTFYRGIATDNPEARFPVRFVKNN